MSAKIKIYITLATWLMISALMFVYLFNILENSNGELVARMTEQRKELLVLEAEQESFRMADRDLETLKQQPLQPDDFFSKDVTLVREIEVLENLGDKYGVTLNLSGLSGTVKGASKAKTVKGDLAAIPYSISVVGPFARVVDVIETLENLDFITTLQGLSLSSDGTRVSAGLGANFYVRK